MDEMNEFFTRDKANEGVEVPLYLPTGAKSKHWLKLLGVDSGAYALATARMRQALQGIQAEAGKIEDKEARFVFVNGKQEEWKNRVLSACIPAWSFETECTEAEKLKFLEAAPQIANIVDTFIADRRLFFGMGQAGLKTSQEVK
jgi:hypothetical protein